MKNNENFKFLYNEMEVIFAKNSNEDQEVFINATQMAKIFGKRPNDFLNLTTTKSLIEAITRKNGIVDNQLVMTKKGGLNPELAGTWLHQDLAIEFAGWLDIEFKLWCNDRLKEIFKFGITGTEEKLQELILSPELVKGLAEQVIKYRNEAEEYKNKLDEQAPKVEYFDNVLDTSNTFNISVIAKDLGMTATSLNKFLHEQGVQFKKGGIWLLYKDYQDLDYARIETTIVNDKSYHHLKWTEKGREFIHELLKNK